MEICVEMSSWKTVSVALIVYIIVLLTICYTLPFSFIYRRSHSYNALFQQVEQETNLRTQAARKYLRALDPQASHKLYIDRLKTGNLSFVVGIITVQRTREDKKHESIGYVQQSVSRIDKIMKQHAYFNNSLPFICNVDVTPSRNQDAVNLYQLMPYTERYGDNTLGAAPLQIPGTGKHFHDAVIHGTVYRKETLDYTYCLLSAATLKPRYIILVEDDALPHPDFPSVVEHMLEFRLKHSHSHDPKSHVSEKEFSLLKLFFPSKWQGFAFEFTRMLDLMSWSVVGATVLICCCVSLSFKWRYINTINKTKMFLFFFFLTMVSCLLVGRQNVSELRRISKYFYRLQRSEGCCTQAMLYPLHVVEPLSQYLAFADSSKHTDLAIMDFISVYKLQALQIEPSVFLHTGMHTSLIQAQKHPEEFIVSI